MKIEHLIFLIHPCCYELPPEVIDRRNLGIYVEREQEVKQKWLTAPGQRANATLFLQLGGPKYVFESAVGQLGEARACYVQAERPGDQHDYHVRLVACIREHLVRYDLDFDPATVTSEIWGESFEGCAPGYSGAFAEHLGLKVPPKMVFEMTVCDARFLYRPRRWESVPLANSDVEAWIFEGYDGTPSAILQARLTAQWLDRRPILLRLDPTRVWVSKKTGLTVWPVGPGRPAYLGEDPATPLPFVLTTSDEYWIRARQMNMDEFRKVIATAVVCA